MFLQTNVLVVSCSRRPACVPLDPDESDRVESVSSLSALQTSEDLRPSEIPSHNKLNQLEVMVTSDSGSGL